MSRALDERRIVGLGVFYHRHFSVWSVPGDDKKQSFICLCPWCKFSTDNTPSYYLHPGQSSLTLLLLLCPLHIISLLKRKAANYPMWCDFILLLFKEIRLYKHQEIIFSTHWTIYNTGEKVARERTWCVCRELSLPIRLVWSCLTITRVKWDYCFSNVF